MPDASPVRLTFDAFELDEANARLTCGGRPVALPPKAFAVLCTLARQRGQLVTKNALLDAVWGHQHVSESLLKNVISEVRAALADDAKRPRYIETASRFGYRFIGLAGAPPSAAKAPVCHLIGRDAALEKIRESWRRARAGERQLLWIAGEAGVGKTTLIETFVSELEPKVAAFGRCIEHFGTGEPYLPVLEVIREICRQEPELPTLMRTIAPTWLIQMPWLVSESERAALHRELAGAHPDRMVREMRELMDRFTLERPIVFILEDMHWSDLGTLRMMEHFARRPRPAPILWIATFRLTQVIAENHPLQQLRQELRLHKLCEEILLDSFSESEVGAYLAARIPEVRFSHNFVKRLHAHTDGLPLYVANIADSIAAQAASDPQIVTQWSAESSNTPLPVPDSLTGVIEKQLSRLSLDVQTILEAGSVCGMEFRAGTVADLLERDINWVRERCDDLVRRRIWLRSVGIVELPDGDFDSRYSLLHALYQHVLYERLTPSQRVQFHRRAARSLDRRHALNEKPTPAELASHYERGHETMAALRAYSEAARSALAHFAPRDAAFLSEHGLSLLDRCPDGAERTEIEMALTAHSGVAASLIHGVGSQEARISFERVQALCDSLPLTPARALTLNGLAWTFYVRGEFDRAIRLARQLDETATAREDSMLFILACNLMGVAEIGKGKLTEGCERLERGIERCSSLAQTIVRPEFVIDPEVSMRLNVAFPLADRGYADRARRHFDLGYERAHRIRQPMAMMLAYWAGGMLEVRLGDPPAAGRHAEKLASLVESAVLRQGEGPSLWLRGYAEAHRGEARQGYQRIMLGYDRHARLGMYAGCTEVLGYAAEALILAGDWQGASAHVNEAMDLADRVGERLSLPYLLLLRARIASAQAEFDAARVSLEASLNEARAQESLGAQLKALVALAELPETSADDRSELRRIHAAITEGFDVPVYRRAVHLISSLPE